MRRTVLSATSALVLALLCACGDTGNSEGDNSPVSNTSTQDSSPAPDNDNPIVSHIADLADSPLPSEIAVQSSGAGSPQKLPLPITLTDFENAGFVPVSDTFSTLDEYFASGPSDERITMCNNDACLHVYFTDTSTPENNEFLVVLEPSAFLDESADFSVDDIAATYAVLDTLGRPDSVFANSSTDESDPVMTVVTWDVDEANTLALVNLYLAEEDASMTEMMVMPVEYYDNYFVDKYIDRYSLDEVDLGS